MSNDNYSTSASPLGFTNIPPKTSASFKSFLFLFPQLPRPGSVVPRYDQVHAVRRIWIKGQGVSPGTRGTFPLQLLSGQPNTPGGRVHPRQVGSSHISANVWPHLLSTNCSFFFFLSSHLLDEGLLTLKLSRWSLRIPFLRTVTLRTSGQPTPSLRTAPSKTQSSTTQVAKGLDWKM